MFALAILFALVATVVYLCTRRLGVGWRIFLALSIFIIGTVGTFAALMSIVDRPPPCSRTIDPKTGQAGPLENCDRRP